MTEDGKPPEKGATDPLQLFVDYPFDSDDTFQQGLASVVAGSAFAGKSEDEKEEVIRLARVFYFNRVTGHSLTPESVIEYDGTLKNVPEVSDPKPVQDQEIQSRSLSFAELKTLIEEGKTDQVPNNKVISDALNDAPPSESVQQPRRKPWETT